MLYERYRGIYITAFSLVYKMVSLELEARLDNLLVTFQEETKDVDLFAPITDREECPICLQPQPIKEDEILFMTCCGKQICKGCIYKNMLTYRKNGVPMEDLKCAFCRQPPPPETKQIKLLKRLMKINIPQAYLQMATRYRSGDGVFQSNTKSIEMYIRAAELGDSEAFVGIGLCYRAGVAVEQDTSKALEFYEAAAKKGSVQACWVSWNKWEYSN